MNNIWICFCAVLGVTIGLSIGGASKQEIFLAVFCIIWGYGSCYVSGGKDKQ